jgi:nitrogenase molybdenum-cofactor synthesis protein NifE
MGRVFNDPDLTRRIENLIKEEEEKLSQDLVYERQILRGLKVVLYTGGVKSWSVITALQELGMKVVAVGTNKSTKDDVARIKERAGHDVELIESDGAARILKAVKTKKADIIIAGGRNMYLALKEQIPFLDINQERHTAYAGYVGLKRLAQHLVHSIQHPIWELVRYKTRWQEELSNDS